MAKAASDFKLLAWRVILVVAGAGLVWVAFRDASLAVMRNFAEQTGQATTSDPWVRVLAIRRIGEDGAPAAIEEGARDAAVWGQRARWIADEARIAGMPAAHIQHVEQNREAIAALRGTLRDGDYVLIKGSRGVAMEQIVAALQPAQSAEAE